MKITTIGIDLAKSVFQIHGVDQQGRKVLGKKMKREQLVPFFAQLPPCLIGMEACASSNYWATRLQELGHTVRRMAPQYVKPYVKTNQNDARDAEAICEAVTRPSMRFVPIKNVEQQTVLSLHRARQGFVRARTAQANQIRGRLAEFGIVMAKGIYNVPKRLTVILAEQASGLPPRMRTVLQRLLDNLKHLNEQVNQLEREIILWHRESQASRRLADIPGVGPLTASALVACIGSASNFRNGRQLAAWLGLVPRQRSSGGKGVLLGISKHGDTYLRSLLVHGARAVFKTLKRKQPTPESTNSWLAKLAARRNPNIAVVALANKNARIAWALLAHDRQFDSTYKSVVPIGT
jgi:transposase